MAQRRSSVCGHVNARQFCAHYRFRSLSDRRPERYRISPQFCTVRWQNIFMRRTVRAVSNTVHTVLSPAPSNRNEYRRRAVHAVVPMAPVCRLRRCSSGNVRNLHDTVINQDHQCLTHLDRGRRPVTLTDTNRNGVTLIPRFFKAFPFPFAGRRVPERSSARSIPV